MAASSLTNSNINRSAVNNGRRTPLQGFDVSIYVLDQGTGNLIPLGEFTGFQHVVRNATEPYLPLGNRTMNFLDGEFQIGWIAEQGKINLEAMQALYGFSTIGPIVRLGRSPRFQIVVEYNAPDLHETTTPSASAGASNNTLLSNDLYQTSQRSALGRYVFGFCKIDAITTGIMAGRTAVADRIEGLAETWQWKPFNTNESPKAAPQVLGARTATRYLNDGDLTAITVPAWAQAGGGLPL